MFAAFATVLLASVAAVQGLVVGNSTVVGRTCGSTPSQAQVAAFEAHFAAHKVTPVAAKAAAAKVISVYFHVVQSGTATTQGAVT